MEKVIKSKKEFIRKPNRLRSYDYGKNGVYYITICTQNKKNMFWETLPDVAAAISRHEVSYNLSQIGVIVDQAIQEIPHRYDGVSVSEYVIMPDHVHMILVIYREEMAMKSMQLREETGDEPKDCPASAPTVARIIGQMKRYVTKTAGVPVWQKSFYDHVVRDHRDYSELIEYIQNNPLKLFVHVENGYH